MAEPLHHIPGPGARRWPPEWWLRYFAPGMRPAINQSMMHAAEEIRRLRNEEQTLTAEWLIQANEENARLEKLAAGLGKDATDLRRIVAESERKVERLTGDVGAKLIEADATIAELSIRLGDAVAESESLLQERIAASTELENLTQRLADADRNLADERIDSLNEQVAALNARLDRAKVEYRKLLTAYRRLKGG